jgi:hypothetical protein
MFGSGLNMTQWEGSLANRYSLEKEMNVGIYKNSISSNLFPNGSLKKRRSLPSILEE